MSSTSRGWLSVGLALLVVLATAGVAVQPAAGAGVQTDGEIFTDAVTDNKGWLGGWSAGEDVPVTADGDPYWVVKYENGSAGDLEAWADASTSRTIRSHDQDGNRMVVSAPAADVGIGTWRLSFSTPLRHESYVEEIGLNRRVSIDPIKTPELKDKSSWDRPSGAFLATAGGFNGRLDPDAAAWGDEVNASTLQEARQSVDADTAGATGSGVRVAILDTGLDYNKDLYGDRVVAGKNTLTNETINTTSGDYSAVADGSSSNHGSWVATAIAGNGTGANATGIAPDASLIPVKVLGDDGSGTTDQIAQGLEYACGEQNADVVSMSLGSPLSSMQIEHEIKECLEEDGVSAVVVAAGNNRMTTRYVQSPGDSDQDVITVAASDARSINESESAYFSAVGPDPETDVQPDVAAPGLKVTAEVDEGNRTLSGTSMATPIVSGVAALTLETQTELKGDPVGLRSYLTERAEPMTEAGETEVGAGRINAQYAVSDTIPSEDQASAQSSSADARDTANSALSGSIFRNVGVPFLSTSIPISVEAAAPAQAVTG